MKHIATFLTLFLCISSSSSQQLIKEFRLEDRPQHLDVKDIVPTEDGYYVIADRSSYEFGIGGPLKSELSLFYLDLEGHKRWQRNLELITSTDTDYGGGFYDKMSYDIEDDIFYLASLSGVPVGENGIIEGYSRQLVLQTYDLKDSTEKYTLLPEPSQYDERIQVLDLEVINQDSIHVFTAPFSDEPRNFFDEYRIDLQTGAFEVIHHNYGNLYVRHFQKEESGSINVMDSVSADWKIISTTIRFENLSGITSEYLVTNRFGEIKSQYIEGEFYILINKKILHVSESGEFGFVSDSIPFEHISDFTYNLDEETFYAASFGSGWSSDTIEPQIAVWKGTDPNWMFSNIPGESLFFTSSLKIFEDQLVVCGGNLHLYNHLFNNQFEYSDSSHVGNGIIRFLDLQFTTPTVDVDQIDFEVSIFPNPAVDHVMVQSPEKMSRIQVFDYAGRLVQDIQNLQLEAYQLSVADLPAGTYQLRISAGDTRISSAPLLVH